MCVAVLSTKDSKIEKVHAMLDTTKVSVYNITSLHCTHVHTHARTHVHVRAHTHTHIHARTHTHAHAHTHTHTHTQSFTHFRYKLN